MIAQTVGPLTVHLFEPGESADAWPSGHPGVIHRGIRGWVVCERPYDAADHAAGRPWHEAIRSQRLPGVGRDDVAGALAAAALVVGEWLARAGTGTE